MALLGGPPRVPGQDCFLRVCTWAGSGLPEGKADSADSQGCRLGQRWVSPSAKADHPLCTPRKLQLPCRSEASGLLCPQIPAAAFSLVTKDGQPVRYDMEVPDSGIDLQCTLAPDGSFAWSWRVKHGQLENRP